MPQIKNNDCDSNKNTYQVSSSSYGPVKDNLALGVILHRSCLTYMTPPVEIMALGHEH